MRASYPRAIAWLALNDDCSWLDDADGFLSVSAAMVEDLFGKTSAKVAADLRAYRKREGLL